ncbi:hypothetical protein BGX21_010221 [Mortierella sp. AD011]|nr:hypothetical protein BGX20_009020 [Mortierella sp. AD010]KAF9394796.1 hypothetical protein BGX21_010221 [Mortierella sp. AD011]
MSIYPSQHPPVGCDGKTPHVMIVGAGLAGLLLAILLDRINVPYEIYERSDKVRPLGGIMSLNANILPALEQLGILEDLKKVSYPSRNLNIYTGSLEEIASVGDVAEAYEA